MADLSFSRPDRDAVVTALPTALAVLLVGMATRQAVSVTARRQALLVRARSAASLLRPVDGAFNPAVAMALTRSQHW